MMIIAAVMSLIGQANMIDGIGGWLSQADRYYLVLAVVGTTVFAIQFAMSMFGGGDFEHDGAMEIHDMDVNDQTAVSEINFFSIKSITGFVTFFGWAGYFWGHQGWSGFFIAVACGLLMMFMISAIIFMLLKMQHSGNITPSDIIDQSGSVYLTVPGGHDRYGKVTVKVQSRTMQVRALAEEELPTGTPVRVVRHVGGDCYQVVRIG